MNMTPRIQLAFHIAAAFAALGASLPSHAQVQDASCYERQEITPSFALDHAALRPAYANGCIRDISGDRAAVLLPSALPKADDPSADKSLPKHAWGFLDENGRIAIRPIFEAVRDFRHGLAAVRWQGKWGFIDKDGRMAVRPRFDALQDMAEVGLAVATLDGRHLLIDRQGNPVGSPFDEDVYSVHLSDGVPARTTLEYKREYRSEAGERRYGARGVIPERPLGENGLHIASNAKYMYGVIDADWNWVVQPVYGKLNVWHTGGPAIGHGPAGSVMVTTQGKVIGADQHYTDMNPVVRGFMSARVRESGDFAILNDDGAVVATLTRQEAETSRLYADTILYAASGTTTALVPGRETPIALGQDLRVSLDVDAFLLLVDSNDSNAGLLTPTGVWLQAGTDQDWVSRVKRIEFKHGRLWISDSERVLINVVDKDGKMLLTPETVQIAQQMRIHALPATAPHAPLALLESAPDACQCEQAGKGAGVILGDGTHVADASWAEVIVLNDEDEEHSEDAKPMPFRYAARTATGMVLLDDRGKPIDLAEQQHIGTFRHGYAPIYGDGVARMIDVDGNVYDLPESFDAQVVAPGIARYLKTAADDEPWGLYDFVAGKELAAPQFRSIADFRDGQAIASMGPDRLGIIDLQGNWVVPAAHRSAKRVNANLWLMSRGGDDEYQLPAAFFNSQGRALTPFEPRLDVIQSHSGSIDAGNARRRWIISSDGSGALDMQDATFSRVGNWMSITRANRQGYLDSQGNWQIALSPLPGTPFQGSPARALRVDGASTQVIDGSGKTLATLAGHEWRWPIGSSTLIRHTSANGRRSTDYADLNGATVLTVEGTATAFSDGRAVTDLPNDGQRAVDTAGKLTGPAFDVLGAYREGLAAAISRNYYGFVGHDGEFVIPAQFLTVSDFANRRAVVSTEFDSRIIDPTGRTLAQVRTVCGIRTLHGSAGQRLWPLRMSRRCGEQAIPVTAVERLRPASQLQP